MLVKGQRWSELRFVPPHVRSIIFFPCIYIYIYICPTVHIEFDCIGGQ
jgi:hypothetical protein